MTQLPAVVEKAAEGYAQNVLMRATVQAIPVVGGSVDTLFAWRGQQIRQERIEKFLQQLAERISEISAPVASVPEEELYDLMIDAFDRVVRTRSEEKRARFAQIISRQVQNGGSVADAETALRVIAGLEDAHIEVLLAAMSAPLVLGLFDGKRVVTIAEKPIATPGGTTSLRLQDALPHISPAMLRLLCSELVAQGLLRDAATSTWGGTNMDYFSPTELSTWLYQWIRRTSPARSG